MKKLTIAVFLTALSLGASATEQITALTPSSRSDIELYDSPTSVQSVKKVEAGDLNFPINIQANQNGFMKISVDGKNFWVKSTQVRVKRDVVASCGGASDRAERVGSTPGAGANACK